MPVDYETEYKNQYKRNVDETPDLVANGEFDQKIENFCALHDFDRNEVIEAIKTSRIVSACFAKKPDRQRFHVKFAADHISHFSGVSNFKNPTNYAKHSLQLGLSIDFEWEYNSYQFYARHKYTSGDGGSQVKAYRDIQEWIEQANDILLDNNTFIVAIQGGFLVQSTV